MAEEISPQEQTQEEPKPLAQPRDAVRYLLTENGLEMAPDQLVFQHPGENAPDQPAQQPAPEPVSGEQPPVEQPAQPQPTQPQPAPEPAAPPPC